MLRKSVVWMGLLILYQTVSGYAQDSSMLGFTKASSDKQLELEQKIIGMPSGERMLVYHRALTAEPHHAGTAANVRTAEYFAERLREFGFDEIEMNSYEALLPRPITRVVELLEPEHFQLKLMEPSFPEDADSGKEGVLPPFNAYSADGDVTAQVLYVNYGIPDDYKILDSLGVSVQGKIVIARYGKSWRGIKPRLAAERGAVGCLIYSDPADDGFVKGDVVPKGKWRPGDGVQRGSVMDMPTYPGDPQTPMWPSKIGAERVPLSEVKTLQKIPVLPISYNDALPILRNLAGKDVPESWRGGLPITYHVGPGPAKVHMNLKFDWSVHPIVNVIGYLRGREEPDKIIMAGGHRDAWTFGGRDPISGAVSLLESARAIAEMAKKGFWPKRTVAFASWDAEEYGLIGSTEYGEEFAEKLQTEVIVYLNRESYTAGNFSAGGVHSLQPFINEITRRIGLPADTVSIFESWRKRAAPNRMLNLGKRQDVRLNALGSGSDYTVFLDHLGIPSINLGFSASNGIYHSRYDSHWFYTTYGDKGFGYGEKLAELVATFMLRMANADVLPFSYLSSAETIDRYLDELDTELEKHNLQESIDLSDIRQANSALMATATVLDGEIQRICAMSAAEVDRVRETIGRLNDLLIAAEQDFLYPEGLPGRPWYRHQIYAPGYGVKTLPGVREAIEKQDVGEAKQMSDILASTLNRVRETLLDAVVVAASITRAEDLSTRKN
ncbi:MAG: transferrin receptor-like dimerization domain-containing protein [bacterium]